MNRVFISYSRRDRHFAERLARDLSDAGLDVWIDFRQIHAGELWQEEIMRGIRRSDFVVVCLSPAAVASEWVNREVNAAREMGKIVLPIMVIYALAQLRAVPSLNWLADVHFIEFEARYEQAFPELLTALPGKRALNPFDEVNPANIPNPFKGLEAFQQTDARFFFGREALVDKVLNRLRSKQTSRLVAVVGASGSGKSSLVRAGVIPQIRAGKLPGSDTWLLAIFAPGAQPINALATRLAPLLPDDRDADTLTALLRQNIEVLHSLTESLLADDPPQTRLLLVVDQFEEVFTRAGEAEREHFLNLLHYAVTVPQGRALIVITMRADFFDRLGRYPTFAALFEEENLVIVTEMTAIELLRTIEGPARAVGLQYDPGLAERILDDVRRQPGSLPLLQYALKALYERREGRRLTTAAYEAIGGVQRALARHAEDIFTSLNIAQQDIMRRVLLRLVEVGEDGNVTRRRVNRDELDFQGITPEAVQQVIDLLTAPESRLLVVSREISADPATAPAIQLEVSHEALLREWSRLREWVEADAEALRQGSYLLQAANDWLNAGRDTAYLLTGTRLLRAEEWLRTADANALQRTFITASVEERNQREQQRQEQAERELALQRQAANRLRGLVAVLVVSLVAAIGLVLFALSQTQLANEQSIAAANAAAIAEANAAEANSFALAASADRALGDNQNELAVALAAEAALSSNPPPQARLTLANVAYAPGTRRRIDVGAEVNDMALDPTGRYAVVAAGSSLTLWDITTGEPVRQFERVETDEVTAVAYTPDGQQIISGDDQGVLIVWDAASGAEIRRLTGDFTGGVTAIAVSPDGAAILTASATGRLALWDAAAGAFRYALTGHNGAVNAVAFDDPVNRGRAASGDRAGNIIVWNVVSGSALQRFQNNNRPVNTLDFYNNIIITDFADNDNAPFVVRAWQVSETAVFGSQAAPPDAGGESALPAELVPDEIARYIGAAEVIRTVRFSRDGSLVVAGTENGAVLVWESVSEGEQTPMEQFEGHTGNVNALVFMPGDRNLVSGGDTTLRLWDIRSAETAAILTGHTNRVFDAVYGFNGRLALSASLLITLNRTQIPDVRLWDITTGRTIQQYRGHDARVTVVDLSPDARFVATGSVDTTARIWDTVTGEMLHTLQHNDRVNTVRFTPDSQSVVTGDNDGFVIVWNVNTGAEVTRFSGLGNSGVYTVAISPNGTQVAAGRNDGSIHLWDINSGELLRTFSEEGAGIRAAAFDADGTRVVTGAEDGSIVIWDTATAEALLRINTLDRSVTSVSFSRDGGSILSTSTDGTLRLWDVQTGFEVRRYSVPGSTQVAMNSGMFSPGGDLVLTALDDDTLRIWRVHPTLDSLLGWVFRNRYVAPLTCPQRVQFRLTPCDADGNIPTRAPLDLPPPPPVYDSVVQLQPGDEVIVNTTLAEDGRVDRQAVRSTRSTLDDNLLVRLGDGARLTLLEGPVEENGYRWWRVRTADGIEGWSAEFEPREDLQMLVPDAFLQN